MFIRSSQARDCCLNALENKAIVHRLAFIGLVSPLASASLSRPLTVITAFTNLKASTNVSSPRLDV